MKKRQRGKIWKKNDGVDIKALLEIKKKLELSYNAKELLEISKKLPYEVKKNMRVYTAEIEIESLDKLSNMFEIKKYYQ